MNHTALPDPRPPRPNEASDIVHTPHVPPLTRPPPQAALPAALSAGATLLLGAVLAWVAVEWTNHYVRGRDRGYVYDKR